MITNLQEAIDYWNNPKSAFLSSICTIFQHTRYNMLSEKIKIDEFDIDFFNDKTEEQKTEFINFINTEIKGINACVDALTNEINQRILKDMMKDVNKDAWKTKRYLFLDIDGTMAGYEYRGFINPKCVELLNQLEGVEIIISSSWGTDADEPLKELGLKLPIIGHTEHFYIDYMCRGNEIEKWLNDHDLGGTKYGMKWANKDFEYAILDDDADFLLGQKNHFVRTDRRTGLTQKNVDKIKKILKL